MYIHAHTPFSLMTVAEQIIPISSTTPRTRSTSTVRPWKTSASGYLEVVLVLLIIDLVLLVVFDLELLQFLEDVAHARLHGPHDAVRHLVKCHLRSHVVERLGQKARVNYNEPRVQGKRHPSAAPPDKKQQIRKGEPRSVPEAHGNTRVQP